MTLEQKIEALLFFKGEPIKTQYFVKVLGADIQSVLEAYNNLHDLLKDRGVVLVQNDEEVTLGTNPEVSSLIKDLAKKELQGALTKNSLETLSIILYHGPLSKPQIDYIRGVNSNFILRNLAIRGLIERKADPKDMRTHIYTVSLDLLSHLGVSRLEDLTGYSEYKEKIIKVLKQENKEQQNDIH